MLDFKNGIILNNLKIMRFLSSLGILLIFVTQCSVDKNVTVNTKTVDLSELDSVDCVLWWEVQNDTLKVWTKEDERESIKI